MTTSQTSSQTTFWPNGEQLVISFSMQFEATGDPSNAESPFPVLAPDINDTIKPTWYRYGMEEEATVTGHPATPGILERC